ncbi:MAG: methylated-DNA--[protein]-cysteine S-methyltransferase [Terriglobales bacterium]
MDYVSQLSTSTQKTPVGPFTSIADDDVVVASGWTADASRLLRYLHPSLRNKHESQLHRYNDLGEISRAVTEYHNGDITAPDRIPVGLGGSQFHVTAWRALRTVPAGTTMSYGRYAALMGKPNAVRAAASVCARNPVALFVPCHRVIRSDGSIGGFGYGVELKVWLLDLERDA